MRYYKMALIVFAKGLNQLQCVEQVNHLESPAKFI